MPVTCAPVWQAKKSPRRQLSQERQCQACQPTPTRWPACHRPGTSLPTASITPTTSCPGPPGEAREGDTGPLALLGKDVAVADAAGLNLDPHGPWSRVGDRALDELEGPAGARDLGDTHRGLEDVHIGRLWCYGWCYGLAGIT